MFKVRPAMSCIASIIVAGVGLAGCIPRLLTAQPKAQILVTDTAGTPMEAATVTLGTVEMHGIVGRRPSPSPARATRGRFDSFEMSTSR